MQENSFSGSCHPTQVYVCYHSKNISAAPRTSWTFSLGLFHCGSAALPAEKPLTCSLTGHCVRDHYVACRHVLLTLSNVSIAYYAWQASRNDYSRREKLGACVCKIAGKEKEELEEVKLHGIDILKHFRQEEDRLAVCAGVKGGWKI